MKKILFVIPSFNIGGTTVSVKNLISVLGKDEYECELLPLCNKGVLSELYKDIPQVTPDFITYSLFEPSCKGEPFFRFIIIASIRVICRKNPRLRDFLFRRSINKLGLKNSYDIVVACQEGLATYFTSMIQCKKKIAWVRCDYSRYLEIVGLDKESVYDMFNNVICVSEFTKEKFISVYPQYNNKTYCIHNPQDANYILLQSQKEEKEPKFKRGKYTILSIGRFDSVKRFDRIPEIAKNLKNKGNSFYWYIIGDGGEKARIVENIEKCGVQDCVILLGVKTNPHYYIRNSDLLVSLSISEACPRVVNEAKILRTPVVSTDYPTIYEYIVNNKTGLITPIENIHEAVDTMMNDKNVAKSIISNISDFKFDNEQILKQIESIFCGV